MNASGWLTLLMVIARPGRRPATVILVGFEAVVVSLRYSLSHFTLLPSELYSS